MLFGEIPLRLTHPFFFALAGSWNLAECLSSGPGGAPASSNASKANGLWYPDWHVNSHVCLKDGKQPNYMTENYATWMYENQEACCDRYYS